MFSNEEAAQAILKISEQFDISVETVEFVYDRLSEYPCFDRENGIMCLGIACELIKDNINKVNRLRETGEISDNQVPEILRKPEFTVEKTKKKSLVLTYDYEPEQNAAVLYELK